MTSLEEPNNDVYTSSGNIVLKDFILDPSVSIVFKMEIQVEMPTEVRKEKENATFTIAWGYFLPTFTSKGEVVSGALDSDLKLGPGMTPDGSILWTPDDDETKLEVSAELTPIGNYDPNEITKRARDRIPKVNVEDSKMSGDSLFEIQKDLDPGTRAIPGDSTMNRDLRRELEKERKDKLKLEKEVSNLHMKNKNISNQLYESKSAIGRSQLDIDEKEIRRDERRNNKILEGKYKKSVNDIQDQYEDRMRKLEDQIIKLSKGGHSKRDSKSPMGRRDESFTHPRGPTSQLPYASNYLADPSIHHPSFYPPDDRDRLIGKSRYIDEDLKILPPPPQIPLELPSTFDLSRDDEIAFVKLGIKDEILKYDHYDQPELEVELKNPLQASDFTFRFIAFKPPISMPYGQSVPRRMYFKFNFFTFQEKITET